MSDVYEVQIKSNGRWTIESVQTQERAAINHAQKIEKKKEGVRVVRERTGNSGHVHIAVIFEEVPKEDENKKKKNVISGGLEPEQAIKCTQLADVNRRPSRKIIGTLLRAYFDELFITPTELLHSYQNLKRLTNADSLLGQAIGIVGMAQSRAFGGTINERRVELDNLYAEAMGMAKKAENDKRLNGLKAGQMMELSKALDASVKDAHEWRYLMTTAVTKSLEPMLGWELKVQALMEFAAEPGLSQNAVNVIDCFIGDILSGSAALAELLGSQPSLGAALTSLAQLCSGLFERKKYMPECLDALNRLFAENKLKSSKGAITDRIANELKSTKLLTKESPEKEIEMLATIVRWLSKDGKENLAGEDLIAAVEERSRYQTAPEVQRLLQAYKTPRDRMTQLLRLEKQVYGKSAKNLILNQLIQILQTEGLIEKWMFEKQSPIERMKLVADIHNDIRKIAVESNEKNDLLDMLDQTIFDYMSSIRLLDMAEQQQPNIALKARKLLSLVHSGAVPKEGKSMGIVKKRVLFHVQQPGFMKVLTQGIEDKTKVEQTLRQFEAQLKEAGIL